jgi:hypothetical protein
VRAGQRRVDSARRVRGTVLYVVGRVDFGISR